MARKTPPPVINEPEILAALLKNERTIEVARRFGVPVPKITAIRQKYGLIEPKKEKIVATCSFIELNRLQQEATKRNILTDRLVSLLISQIIADNLFSAVLDDLDDLP